MPNRLIKESICTSDNLNLLTAEEERFFYRLIVNCDDFGRFDGRSSIIRARLFPLKLGSITEKQVMTWVKSLVKADLVYLYEVKEGQNEGQTGIFIQVKKWESHQQVRAKRSKYPDSNGNQLISDDYICPRNPIQSNPIRTPQNGVMFQQFWDLYPKKKAKQDAIKAFNKINPDELMMKIMLRSLELAKTSEDWLKDKGRYIPHPATWLNGRRWEDEGFPEPEGEVWQMR